ncbi:MAG: DNA polymerase IV [Spirochaetota bacterium]
MKINDMSPLIVHVDMDAFFASIEQLDHPCYRGKPVIVGADPQGGSGRGVVSAASYEARTWGVRSAMPISTAYKLCPGGIYVRPRMQRYREVSSRVMKLLEEFSPLVEQISVDEAFLDCTGTECLFGSGEKIGRMIKSRIYQNTSLTASVGIASNKSVAKIASELCKPDGLLLCPPGKERDFLSELPLHFLWGAGVKTIAKLKALGYSTIGNIASASPEKLADRFGKHGTHLWSLANGIDPRPVATGEGRKSISEETTFSKNVRSETYIKHTLFRIADSLTRKMRHQGIKGKKVTLKIRLEDFQTFTRTTSFCSAENSTDKIKKAVELLFDNFNRMGKKVRLLGICVSGLETSSQNTTGQLALFSGTEEKDNAKEGMDELLDKLKNIYGDKITRAAFLSHPPDKN